MSSSEYDAYTALFLGVPVCNRLPWIKVTWLTHNGYYFGSLTEIFNDGYFVSSLLWKYAGVQLHFRGAPVANSYPRTEVSRLTHRILVISRHVGYESKFSHSWVLLCNINDSASIHAFKAWLTYQFKRNIHSILMIPCQNPRHWNSLYIHWCSKLLC